MPRLRGRSVEVQRIEQGYLPGSIITERIRSVHDRAGQRYLRPIKTGNGIVRGELEEETTEELFRQLWPLTKGRRLRKRRYKVEDGTLTWEIDRFDHIGLVMAEIELPAADSPVIPPAEALPSSAKSPATRVPQREFGALVPLLLVHQRDEGTPVAHPA